jgi:hypothetical protein
MKPCRSIIGKAKAPVDPIQSKTGIPFVLTVTGRSRNTGSGLLGGISMKDGSISLTGSNGEFNRQMYKTMVSAMDPKTQFVFLSYQIVLGIENLYPDPGPLLDKALEGKDFVALRLPIDVIQYIITVFNESLPAEARGKAAESFITNLFIKGVSKMIGEIGPGGEKRAWMSEIMDRLKEMIDLDQEE